MTLHLCGPGTLLDDLGEEHLPGDLEAAFAVRRKVPGSFVKRGRQRITLVREDFSGFLIELLRIVRGDRIGRLAGQEYLGSELSEIALQDFRNGEIEVPFLYSSVSSVKGRAIVPVPPLASDIGWFNHHPKAS